MLTALHFLKVPHLRQPANIKTKKLGEIPALRFLKRRLCRFIKAKPKASRTDYCRAVVGRALQLDGCEGALTIVTRERLQLRHVAAVVPRAVRIFFRECDVVAPRAHPALVKTSLRQPNKGVLLWGLW